MAVATYKIATEVPAQEKYGLASQMQWAVVSLPANVAEGYGRLHHDDYDHPLSIARGSFAELETHITNAVLARNPEKNPSMYVVHALACARAPSLHACPHAKA